jgi:hypothetical protein
MCWQELFLFIEAFVEVLNLIGIILPEHIGRVPDRF